MQKRELRKIEDKQEVMKRQIVKQAAYWGLKYDIDVIEITNKQIKIADKYSLLYCREKKCVYDYACCHKCHYHNSIKGCTDEIISDSCRVFFCSPIIKKMEREDRKALEIDFLLNG